ncbi:DUF2339 domain-containing protein [Corynebacterium comes]|uniref:DUF2339 domain-containing protein n=1 Tax=Corynebacterium comes TaxID=2675218 RepID=A0A6B8VXQ3_9CORY|nr:DUF2339 domain-containing protein [Corynebacterium comes]QGU04497.1 hypothetical protein CETAM_06155 [Corynebacterium comes]
MTTDPRDALELRLTLRRLEAAEAAIADARRSLDAVLTRQAGTSIPDTPVPAPTVTPAPAPAFTRDPFLRFGHRADRSPIPPAKPPKPAKPPVPTETKVIRAIAVVGSLITVAGVALAVTLAIQAGLLGPLGRVLLSVLLAVALLGAGLWLDSYRHKATDRDTAGMVAGVTALVVTSWLVSATIIYALVQELEWWPAWLGALVLMAVWLVFLAISVIRRLSPVAVSMGLSILPVATVFYDFREPVTWLVTLLPLTLLAVTRGRKHPEVRLVTAAVAVLLQAWLLNDVVHVVFSTPRSVNLTIALVGMVSALAFAAMTLRFPKGDRNVNLLSGIVTPLALLGLAAPAANDTWAIWLLVPTAVGLAAIGYLHKDLLGMVGVCATAVAFVLVWWLTPPLGAGALIDATIVTAVFFAAAVLTILWLERRKETSVWPWAFWLAAALVVTMHLSRNVLGKSPVWLIDHVALVQALLIAVFLGVALARRRALAGFPVWAQVVFAVAALHLSMVTVVTAATWLGNIIGGNTGMWLGYLTGHALVSILWMVLAAWILLAARGMSDRASLGAGVVLAIAGVVKLVVFDLGTLEGLPRAMAFLVSGVALLAIAALRTRRRPSGAGDGDTHPDEQQDGRHPARGSADVEGDVNA